MTTAALIVAAGRGTRASNADTGLSQKSLPKQYARLAGRPLLAHVVAAFDACPGIDAITVVIHEDDREAYEAAVTGLSDRLTSPVVGGATRQASVRLGLEGLRNPAPDYVLIDRNRIARVSGSSLIKRGAGKAGWRTRQDSNL